jgi:TonB family protein
MSQVSSHLDPTKRPPDRRAHARQPVRSLAYVELGDGNGGIALNVSEGGLAVQAVMSLGGNDLPAIRIQLAHSRKQIQAKGRVAWTGDLRKLAGVEFVDLSDETRAQIREWVSLESPDPEPWQKLEEPSAESATAHAPTKVTEPLVEPLISTSRLEANKPFASRSMPKFSEPPAPPTRPRAPVVPASAVPPAFVPAPFQKLPVTSDIRKPTPVLPSTTVPSQIAPPESRPKATESVAVSPPPPSFSESRRDAAALPPDRFGFRPLGQPETAFKMPAQEDSEKGNVARWVAIFAVVSLGAGWFAGRGDWRTVVQRISGNPASNSVAAENAGENNTATPPNISDIEVLGLNNHRWLIPMEGSTAQSSTPTTSNPATSGAPAARNPTDLREWTLSPSSPVQPRSSAAAIKATPPVLAPSTGAPDNILPTNTTVPREPVAVSPPLVSTAANDLQPGELVRKVEPVYPAAALAQKVEGTVKILAVIDTEGNVKTAQPLSGPRMLIPAALGAVRQWHYSPTLLHGQKIETQREITVVFQVATAAP